MNQQRLSLVNAAGVRLCGALGLFRSVIYVSCGQDLGHGGKCAYAVNPLGEKSAEREPLVEQQDVEAVHGDGEIPALAVLLRQRQRVRIAVG